MFIYFLLCSYLLGDNGYACTKDILTPVLGPQTAAERRYNVSHIRTRNTVERCFGVWKSRFRCLRNTIRFTPKRCCNVILATAILHNFAKQQGEPDMAEVQDEPDVYNHQVLPPIANGAVAGNATRDHVIRHAFS